MLERRRPGLLYDGSRWSFAMMLGILQQLEIGRIAAALTTPVDVQA
jgi:hypothetical protein